MLNPGDPKALEQGCVCPADTNQHGKGTHSLAPGNTVCFLIDKDCPMHGESQWRGTLKTDE